MKSCPKCNRTFPDETQKFCTFDGGLLISAQPFDPNATVRTTTADMAPASPPPAAQDDTSRDLPSEYATIIDHSKATMMGGRNTAPTGGQHTTGIEPPPPPPVTATEPPVMAEAPQRQPTVPPTPVPPPPPPPSVTPTVPPSAPVTMPPSTNESLPLEAAPETVVGVTPPAIATPKKKSKMPLIIAGLVILLLLGGGALAGAFFFIIKPALDQRGTRQATANENTTTDTNANTNANTTSTANANAVAEPSPSLADTYVAPPGTVEFVNSSDKLDGRLAEHYMDFSFYYPEGWAKDPKAGVPGAANFARVERRIPPDFTQESFSVGWYTSSGTFVADLPAFPKRVEEFSSALAKIYPQYEKVSEGATKINSMDAYEFRWTGLSKGTEKGDLQLWGRIVFLPTGHEGDTTGATLTMFSTSLAGELSSVEDVGEKGEMPVILESFRFKKK